MVLISESPSETDKQGNICLKTAFLTREIYFVSSQFIVRDIIESCDCCANAWKRV